MSCPCTFNSIHVYNYFCLLPSYVIFQVDIYKINMSVMECIYMYYALSPLPLSFLLSLSPLIVTLDHSHSHYSHSLSSLSLSLSLSPLSLSLSLPPLSLHMI